MTYPYGKYYGGLMQITLKGKTMDEVAIERIQEHEPPEGYYLGFSGGKDSVCIRAIGYEISDLYCEFAREKIGEQQVML